MLTKSKEQRVEVLIDVQNLYYSARNLYHTKVNFQEVLKGAIASRKFIRAFGYVVRTKTGEEKPLGIIICADKDQEDIELLELGKNGIHVSQYLAELPPRKSFEKKLWGVIENAREKYARLEQLSDDNVSEKSK